MRVILFEYLQGTTKENGKRNNKYMRNGRRYVYESRYNKKKRYKLKVSSLNACFIHIDRYEVAEGNFGWI